MRLEERRDDHVVTLRPEIPQLTAAVADDLKAAAFRRVRDGDRHLVLDLGEVEFVDSTALGAIVAILKAVAPEGHVVLCNVSGPVRSMLAVTRMTSIFTTFATADEARASLSAEIS